MTHEERQAQLLEDYLNALRTDPNAKAPAKLDPEMAAFARMMAQQHTPQHNPGGKERVWHRVGSASGKLPDETTNSLNHNQKDKLPMTTLTIEKQSPARKTPWYTLAAALFAGVALLGLLMTAGGLDRGGNNEDPGSQGAGVFQQEFEQTATQLILLATETAVVAQVEPTVDPFALTATQLVAEATQAVETLIATQTGITAPGGPTATFTETSIPPVTPVPQSGGGGGSTGPGGPGMPTLDVIFAEIPPQTIELGEVYTGAFTLDTPYATFEYVAPEDMILVYTVETEYGSVTERMSIQSQPTSGPFGGGGGGGGGGGPVQFPGTVNLSEGDTYNVAFSGIVTRRETSNTYTIRFEQLAPATISAGETITGDIAEETPYRAYSFPVAAGEIVTVTVDGELDTEARLQSQDFRLFGNDDDGGPGLNPEIYRVGTAYADEGIVIISPAVGGDTGTFDMIVTTDQASDISGEAQTIRLSEKDNRGLVRVSGEAGTVGTIAARPLGGEASLGITITDGERELASTRGDNMSQLLRDFTFPESGEAYVEVFLSSSMGPPTAQATDVEVSLVE